MKFNLNSLKNMFSALRKSPIDDMAINAVKNNADDVARLAANNMPSTGSTLQKVLSNADDISEVIDFMPIDNKYARVLDPRGATDSFGVHSYFPPEFDFEENQYYPGGLFIDIGDGVESPKNIYGDSADIPFEDLVTERSSDGSLYKIRPHKNTALGKYYQKQLNSKPHLTSSEFVSNYKASMPRKSEERALRDLFPQQYASAPTELDLINAPLPEEPVNFKLNSTPDYTAEVIDPYYYGRRYDRDSILHPDGFEFPEDFANYYTALEAGIPYRYASTAAIEDAYRSAADPHIYSYINLPEDLRNSIRNFEEYGSGLYEGYDDVFANSMYDSHEKSLKEAVRRWLYNNPQKTYF